MRFTSLLDKVDFRAADLRKTDFSEAKFSNFFSTKIFSLRTNELLGAPLICNFEGAKFSTRSFAQVLQLYAQVDANWVWNLEPAELEHTKCPHFESIELSEVDFLRLNSEYAFQGLLSIQFEAVEFKNKVLSFGELAEVTIDHSMLDHVTIRDYRGNLKVTSCQFQGLNYQHCDLSRSSEIFLGNVGQMLFEDTTLNIKQWLYVYDQDRYFTEHRNYSGIYIADVSADPMSSSELQAVVSRSFEAVRHNGETFSHLLRLGFRSFPRLALQQANLPIILKNLDLSSVDICGAKLQGVELQFVTLSIDQFAQFYAQGCRDFSKVRLTGTLNPTLAGELSLKDAVLSKSIVSYLLENDVKDFSETDLQHTENILENYLIDPNYHFQNARFPAEYEVAFQEVLQNRNCIETLDVSQTQYYRLAEEFRRIFTM